MEEDFQSKAHLTRHQTGDRFDLIRERAEVNSPEELDWLHNKEYYGIVLGLEFYKVGVAVYGGWKISKDRGSRKENVEVLRGMYEEWKRDFTAGAKVRDAIIDYRRDKE